MSYRDPRDPRTARYDPTRYEPESRYEPLNGPNSNAYSQTGDPYGQTEYYPIANQQPPKRRRGPNVNPVLFTGGVVMTGVVTGLAAWLVAWLIRAIVQRVNEAGKFGVWNPVSRDEYWFAIVGFLCALAAGAFWYVLQLTTPSPDQFYKWIVALLIAAAVVIPLVLSAEVSVGIGTAVMHLVIGMPVLILIPTMGNKSVER